MKKKILVVNHQMQLGGVCIAAKNFIENMKDDYDIEYLLAKPNGELDNRMPKGVKVSYVPYPLNVAPLGKKECFKKGIRYLYTKAKIRMGYSVFGVSTAAKKLCKNVKTEEIEYDLLVNNDMDMSKKSVGACHAYSKYIAKAKIKMLIIHGDFIANGYDVKFFEKEYIPTYDYIVVLSENLRKQMIDLFPNNKEKFLIISNFEAVDEIKRLSGEKKVTYADKLVNIVSASRLTEVKGLMRSLKVFKRLRDEGFDFCWNIVGDGEQRKDIERYISNNQLGNVVKLWGLQKNPYPFMKAADLLYLGSYHESYGLVLIESLIVGRPVVTTNTASAEEIVDKKYGWICDNSEEGIYNSFKQILSNKNEIKEKTDNLKNYIFDNKSIKEKYSKIIGE